MAEPIKNFDRDSVERFIVEAKKHLETLADWYGLKVDVGRWTYSNTGGYVRSRIQFSVLGKDGARTPEREEFKYRCKKFGLQPTDLDKEFKWYDGRSWRIIGIKTRTRKYPIVAESVDSPGKVCRFPHMAVQECLGRLDLAAEANFGPRVEFNDEDGDYDS